MGHNTRWAYRFILVWCCVVRDGNRKVAVPWGKHRDCSRLHPEPHPSFPGTTQSRCASRIGADHCEVSGEGSKPPVSARFRHSHRPATAETRHGVSRTTSNYCHSQESVRNKLEGGHSSCPGPPILASVLLAGCSICDGSSSVRRIPVL